MKKITLLLLLLSSFRILFAQAPQKMSYQSVIRKADGTLVANTLVGIKTSIIFDTATGNPRYVETQTTTTNNNGLATIEIGGGTPVIGTFAAINWGAGSHFIRTEIDPTGGSNYVISGTSQLLSVPYALYAGSSQNKGKTSILIVGDITDAEAEEQIKSELGPYTENIYVSGTTNLTTLDLSLVKKLISLQIVNNANLVSVSVNNLNEIYDELYIDSNEKLSSFSFPVLKTVLASEIYFSGNSSLTSISFPSLTKSKTIYIRNNAVLSVVDLPGLSSFSSNQYGLHMSKNALPSSQINLLLSRLVNIPPITGKYIDLSGQNPAAPPTGQGIIDKGILISKGYSVTTD